MGPRRQALPLGGQVVQGPASRAQVESLMGSGAFNGATFTEVGGIGTGGGLPGGAFSCSYDGPRFKHGGKTLQATVTVACNGTGVCP